MEKINTTEAPEKKEHKKLFSFSEKIVVGFASGFIVLFVLMFLPKVKESSRRKAEIKKRLKYFNPTIKSGFWGEYVEWEGRPKPLTEKEVEALL